MFYIINLFVKVYILSITFILKEIFKMSNEITIAMLRVVEEIIKLKRLKTSEKNKRIWTKKWIMRRNTFGASSSMIQELAIEDPKSYFNFLRIDETMFNILLAKVTYHNSNYLPNENIT